jgi:hypothetical protein
MRDFDPVLLRGLEDGLVGPSHHVLTVDDEVDRQGRYL